MVEGAKLGGLTLGVKQRRAPELLENTMICLSGAFTILWAITFGYILSLHARQKQLARKLEGLPKDSRTSSLSEDCQS